MARIRILTYLWVFSSPFWYDPNLIHILFLNHSFPPSLYGIDLGRLADIFGRKLLFMVGTAWFSIASLAVAFSPNKIVLIVLMALMGLGPACNTPAAVGLFGTEFEGKAKGRAFASAYCLPFLYTYHYRSSTEIRGTATYF